MRVSYNNSPKITDTVVFDLLTTDLNGIPINPYQVNTIIIYFIERGFTTDNIYQYTKTLGNEVYTEYFSQAVTVATFGNAELPAWSGTQQDFITQVNVGTFRFEWNPSLTIPITAGVPREGDYLLCYQWTPLQAGDTISNNISFYLFANTQETTSIPTHYTQPLKYETLLDRYQPEMFSIMLGNSDLTPDILNRLNLAIAKGFTNLEDQCNQILDLLDANAISDTLLPYLGNLLGIKLLGQDTVLWRRQIKTAVPLAKQKGTLAALQQAFANADMQFINFTRLWQIVSSSTWQDGFVVTAAQAEQSTPIIFTLSKTASLPVNTQNFAVSIRYANTTVYIPLTFDYVIFGNNTVTWVGDNLSMNPIVLETDDVVVVLYEISPPTNQANENYIRTLPLADQRDEVLVSCPPKNWNVRLIAENDPMFNVLIPERHPFTYPVVFGNVRTEFPYSENIYNMDEYNGGTRPSTQPCDLDKTFLDSCSSCLSSKFTIDIEIESLSAQRINEVNDIITGFVPFHAVIHSVNFSGSQSEFFPPPVEETECLVTVIQNDNVVATQMDFNRLIYDGASDALTLKRNMLANTIAHSYVGTGYNQAITLFSPGIQFDSFSLINTPNTLLEILSGTDQGQYQVSQSQKYTIDVIQGSPNTIHWPLDTSGFPFRISKLLFNGLVDIVEINDYRLSDANAIFVNYGTTNSWSVVVTAGPHAGSYSINSVNPDNTISINSFPVSSVSNLIYELKNQNNQVRYTSSTGIIATTSGGVIDFGINAYDMGIRSSDYVEYLSTQYKVGGVDSKATILNYNGGNVIGSANVNVYRRVIDNAVGYLSIRGMQINGTVPTIDYTAETNTFRENYLVLIGTSYYQLESVSGSTMVLSGPTLSWGLAGTSVNYSIVQYIKTSPITTEVPPSEITYAQSLPYNLLDRRGNDSIQIQTETEMPMFMRAELLNGVNKNQPVEVVTQQEQIWYDVEYR